MPWDMITFVLLCIVAAWTYAWMDVHGWFDEPYRHGWITIWAMAMAFAFIFWITSVIAF